MSSRYCGEISSDEERELNEIKSELISSADSVDDKLPKYLNYRSAPTSPSKRTVSRRPNVEFTLLSVRDRISSFENLPITVNLENLPIPVNSFTMSLAEEIKPLKLSRGSYKGKITHVLNGLKDYSDAGTLEELFVKKQAAQVTNYLNKIEEIDQKLSEA